MDNHQLVIVAGGDSAERNVSLLSARNFMESIQQDFPQAKLLILEHDGLIIQSEDRTISGASTQTRTDGRHAFNMADCPELRAANIIVLPLIHGSTGQDGTLQGFLELCKIPYIGCGVRASATCMDKDIFKSMVAASDAYGFKQTRYVVFRWRDWSLRPSLVRECVEQRQMLLPLVVKPCSLGSSIGVSKVETFEQLENAITQAFQLDNKVIVEEAIMDLCEFEIGIMGNDSDGSICASPIAKIANSKNFQDYESKYASTDSSIEILVKSHDRPPEEQELLRRIEVQALDAYRVMDCRDLARIDFLYNPRTKELYLNEIETLPGMTHTSLFLKLWKADGKTPGALIATLMSFAAQRV
jgi:D-alanine-D-alanine ligase